MSVFDGTTKQAGSIDAQSEGAVLAYHAYQIACEELDIKQRQTYYQEMALEQKEALLDTQQMKTTIHLEQKSRVQILPDFMQTFLQALIGQFKKMFQHHQDSIRVLVRELKTIAKKIGIEDKKVDEFVAKVDEEIATALPVRNPEAAASAAALGSVPVLTPPRAIDRESELGFSAADARKMLEVKQKQEESKQNILSKLFITIFKTSLKPKAQRDNDYSHVVDSLKRVTISIINEKFNHRLEILSLLSNHPADLLKQPKNTFNANF